MMEWKGPQKHFYHEASVDFVKLFLKDPPALDEALVLEVVHGKLFYVQFKKHYLHTLAL